MWLARCLRRAPKSRKFYKKPLTSYAYPHVDVRHAVWFPSLPVFLKALGARGSLYIIEWQLLFVKSESILEMLPPTLPLLDDR